MSLTIKTRKHITDVKEQVFELRKEIIEKLIALPINTDMVIGGTSAELKNLRSYLYPKLKKDEELRNCRMKVRNGEIILWKLSSRFKEPELKEN